MATLRDDQRLAEVRPNDLQDYLLSKGWHLGRAIRDKIAVWEQPEADAEVWVPLKRALDDYRSILVDLFETLQELEDRSYDAILRDLQLVWADVLKVRVNHALVGSDTIKLTEGVALVERTRDMLLSAARAALTPRAVYSSRPSQQASEYLRQARLGQTEIGSYVITIISPVAQDAQQIEQSQPEPFTRQVTRMLAESLTAARTAAEAALRTQSMDSFDRAIEHGVSANLCEALIGLAHASRDNAVEVGFSWAHRLALRNPQDRSIILPAEVVMAFSAAAQHLREKEPEEDFQTRGTVHRLQDVPERPGVSIATISGLVDGSPRSLKAQVEGANRAKAIKAFDERLEVMAEGTLDRRTAPYTLTEPISIYILSQPEEDS